MEDIIPSRYVIGWEKVGSNYTCFFIPLDIEHTMIYSHAFDFGDDVHHFYKRGRYSRQEATYIEDIQREGERLAEDLADQRNDQVSDNASTDDDNVGDSEHIDAVNNGDSGEDDESIALRVHPPYSEAGKKNDWLEYYIPASIIHFMSADLSAIE